MFTAKVERERLQRHGRSVAEDVRVAGHEGGHAICRWRFGLEIESVTITPETDDIGRVINGRVMGNPGNIENDAEYFNRLITTVAGNIAEDIYLGECKGLRGSDRRKAYRYAGALAVSDEAIAHLIAAAEAEARYILNDNLHVLDAIATKLLGLRSMTGTEVLALIHRVGGVK